MDTSDIIEPIGPCPLTGYPLVAVHETSGVHAGLAIATLEEQATLAAGRDTTGISPLRLDDVATPAELLRSWTELLIFAVAQRHATQPMHAIADNTRCLDLIQTRHHYDTGRIVAALHVAVTEHLDSNGMWAAPELVLVPDVGVDHVRTATHTVVRRIAGDNAALVDTVTQLRALYVERLAEVG